MKKIISAILFVVSVFCLSVSAQENTLQLQIDDNFAKEFLTDDIDSVTIEDIRLDFDAEMVSQKLNQATFVGHLSLESKYCDSVALGVCFYDSELGRLPQINDNFFILKKEDGVYKAEYKAFQFGRRVFYRPFVYLDGQVYYGEKRIFEIAEVTTFMSSDDFVDLGLPSGLKWANKNIGATDVYDCGKFYAWGSLVDCRYNPDATPRLDYDKYNKTDGLTVLQPEDDIATKTLGAPYRMPTKEELNELCDNCTIVNNLRFISFIGPNDNIIIFPYGSLEYNNLYYTGSIWSSNLRENDDKFSCFMGFSHYDYIYSVLYKSGSNTIARQYGLCVRAVCP